MTARAPVAIVVGMESLGEDLLLLSIRPDRGRIGNADKVDFGLMGAELVRLAVLAVNTGPIKKIVAANKKQLHPACASPLEVLGNISFVTNPNIDRDAGCLCLEL